MIGIKVNGQFLDLSPNAEINLKLNNPIFADGNVIEGSYSLPFEIPAGDISPRNAQILGHNDVIDNAVCADKLDAELYYDGVLYKTGKLVMKKAGETVTTNFIFGFAAMSEEFKTKSIRDIISGSVTLFTPVYIKEVTLTMDISNTDISITINGFTYTETLAGSPTDTNYNNLLAAINTDTSENNCQASYINGSNELKLIPDQDQTDIETEFNITGNPLHWDVSTNYPDYFDYVKGGIEPYFDTGSQPDDIIRFPMIKNDGMYANGEHVYQHSNTNLNGELSYNIAGGSDVLGLELGLDFTAQNHNSICPQVKIQYVIEQIATYFGIGLSGDFITTEWYTTGLIFNTFTIDVPVNFLGEKPVLFFNNTVTLSDHIPDLRINDFFKALQTRFNIAVYLDEKTNNLILNSRNTIVGNLSYQDITHLSSTPRLSEIACKSGLRLRSMQYEDDEASRPDQYEIGTLIQTEIATKLASISSNRKTYDYIIGGSYVVPYVFEKPNAKPFRLIFEYPDKPTISGGNTFHTAYKQPPTLFYNYNNTMFIDGAWDQYIRFLLGRKLAIATIAFEIRHLLEIDHEQKYRVDRINYLYKSIDITLTMTGIRASNVQLYST